LQDQSPNNSGSEPAIDLSQLVKAVVKVVLKAKQTQNPDEALVIRDELHRLPDQVMTEVLNQVMLELVQIDPTLCRWFIVDVFLRDADPEGRADVAERINVMMAELQ
jgi:hypothetical protein